jgi:hypothetical protein
LLKVVVILFDKQKEVKKKDEDKEWFLVGKNQLMKNAAEFKETLKRRIKQEEITEKQFNNMMKEYNPEKINPE